MLLTLLAGKHGGHPGLSFQVQSSRPVEGLVLASGDCGWTPTEPRSTQSQQLLLLAPQLICSYILRPVAFTVGVAWEGLLSGGGLLGMKLFLSRFVAYQGSPEYKQRRLASTEEVVGSKKQWISVSVPVSLGGA